MRFRTFHQRGEGWAVISVGLMRQFVVVHALTLIVETSRAPEPPGITIEWTLFGYTIGGKVHAYGPRTNR